MNTSVYVGVRFKPGRRKTLEVLVAVARPQPSILAARAASRVKLRLRLPSDVRFRWGSRSQEVNAFSSPGAPRALCAVRVGRRKRMRAELAAGQPLSYPKGSNADPRAVLVQSLAAACGRPYDAAFETAIAGRGGPGPVEPPPSGLPAFASTQATGH